MKPPKGKPCADCPMRRASTPGWLGSDDPQHFIGMMHSDTSMPCHIAIDYDDPLWQLTVDDAPQCSGQAIYLSNVDKWPCSDRDGHVVRRLPADRETVFASPVEFLLHHTQIPPEPER